MHSFSSRMKQWWQLSICLSILCLTSSSVNERWDFGVDTSTTLRLLAAFFSTSLSFRFFLLSDLLPPAGRVVDNMN